ncbi:hypothetical protein P7D98_00755 [Enterococcus avium]|uniref:hypothetical protein n=1 Tax=Enterococcus TaxID=1350 RepID=UPI0028928196|nr:MULTISPECIES: hypothetical protein [Enterococcus]MDT2464401.1 hypothetical protein [Enterococcus avium]MDT2503599.1 hypothetical protein [Enterococcus avium]MDT2557048.1 hypothetical protein [Enterococcus raffinosus]
MKKHVLIEAILILIILGNGLWNIQQQQGATSLRKNVSILKKEKKIYKQEKKRLISENEHLLHQGARTTESVRKAQQTQDNSRVNVDLNSEFTVVVNNLFEANLNFTPENLEEKKKEIANYLSKELIKEYFGQNRKTYQEANGTSSRLESLDIYQKKLQNEVWEGLVVVYYKSKQINQDWKMEMNIFRLTYDDSTGKIIRITNLGNGYWNN